MLDLEKTMDIVSFRKYLISNLDKYSRIELEEAYNNAKNNFDNIEEKYYSNKDAYEASFINMGYRYKTYEKALQIKPKLEPIRLKLDNDGMQYKMF